MVKISALKFRPNICSLSFVFVFFHSAALLSSHSFQFNVFSYFVMYLYIVFLDHQS